MPVLSVSGLCKSYPGFSLREVSFELAAGRITGFIGRNGAGKTTTLKSLLNFVHPDRGEVNFFGLPFLGNESAVKRRIGFVSGGVDYYPRKKLRAIAEVTRRFYSQWDEAAYRRYLSRFQLDEGKTPAALSAGMRVKYALALALSHHAELLLLDEPTSGLDPVSRDDLLDVFLALAEEEGVSILFSTHITADLDKCADRILYLQKGHLAGDDTLDGFCARYRLVHFAAERPTAAEESTLLGWKRTRDGFTGLLPADGPTPAGAHVTGATLDDILVHLEKENEPIGSREGGL